MNIFELWKESIKDAMVVDYTHSEKFSANGKTQKIVLPPKPGYDMIGLMINVDAVTLTATAAEAVVSGAKSLMDLMKNFEGRISNKVTTKIRDADIMEAILKYFHNEDIVASSGRVASQLADFAGAGTADHTIGIILPFIVKDGEGQAVVSWEWNAITSLFAADVSIAAHNWELIPLYGHYDGPAFGLKSTNIEVVADGDKDISVELRGQTNRAEIFIGIGADTYIDNMLGKDSNGIPVVNAEGGQYIALTENLFEVTRATGEFVIPHLPAAFSSFLIENAHTSAITPEVISVYDRVLLGRTKEETVQPEVPRPSPPQPTPEMGYSQPRPQRPPPGNQTMDRRSGRRRGGLLGGLLG